MSRVSYREGRLLRAEDLRDEQAYRLELRRRHALAQHGPGIVSGLWLNRLDRSRIAVEPGVAVDGYGRQIVLSEPAVIDAADRQDLVAGGEVAVWLLYGREPSTPRRRGRWECGPGRHSRWRESCRLRLTRADAPEPVWPPCPARPHEPLPDDAACECPVLLGRIDLDDPASTPSGRRYVPLVGDLVRDPRDRVRLRLPETPERLRFAVSLRGAGGERRDRLTVDDRAVTAVRGDATVEDDVVLLPTAEDRERQVGFGRLAEPPAEALPWSIYRTAASGGGDELRVELLHPGDAGDAADFRLVIGRDDGNGFQPCLTVGADCTLTVHGSLKIEGQLVEAPRKADPNDPRFAAEAAKALFKGVGAALGQTASLEVSLDVGAEDGQSIQVDVTARNTGPVPLASIRVSVTGPHISGPVEETIPLLEPGEAKTLSLEVSAPSAGQTSTLFVNASAIPSGQGAVTAFAQAVVSGAPQEPIE